MSLKSLYKKKRFKIQIATFTAIFIAIIYCIATVYFFIQRMDATIIASTDLTVDRINLFEEELVRDHGDNSYQKIEDHINELTQYGLKATVYIPEKGKSSSYGNSELIKENKIDSGLKGMLISLYAKIFEDNQRLFDQTILSSNSNRFEYTSVNTIDTESRFINKIKKDLSVPEGHELKGAFIYVENDITYLVINVVNFAFDKFFPFLFGYVIAGILASFFSVKIAFKPLIRMINEEFQNVRESNFRKRMRSTDNYDTDVRKVIDVMNVVINDMEGFMKENRSSVEYITHEIKNHLSIVKSTIDIVERYGHNDEKRIKKAAALMDGEIKRALSTIDSINSLIHLNSDLTKTDMVLSDIEELVNTVVEEHRRMFPETVFNISMHNYKLNIDINPKHFYLALSPIVTNAAEYSIDLSDVEVIIKNDEKMVYVYVINKGIDIPEEELPYIFMEYFRGSTVKNTVKGNGIGLSLTQRIVNIYDGRISVKSKDGITTFILSFPLVQDSTL